MGKWACRWCGGVSGHGFRGSGEGRGVCFRERLKMSIMRGLWRLGGAGKCDCLPTIGQVGGLSGKYWLKDNKELVRSSILRRHVASSVQGKEKSRLTVKRTDGGRTPISIETGVESGGVDELKRGTGKDNGAKRRTSKRAEDVQVGRGVKGKQSDGVWREETASVGIAEQRGLNDAARRSDLAENEDVNVVTRRGSPGEAEKYLQADDRRNSTGEEEKATWLDTAHGVDTAEKIEAEGQDLTHQKRLLGREHTLERSKTMWTDAKNRASVSEKLKALWQDPEYRKRMSERRKAKWQDPEYRKRISDERKSKWQDSEYRKHLSKQRKTQWKDPSYRGNIADKAKASWEEHVSRSCDHENEEDTDPQDAERSASIQTSHQPGISDLSYPTEPLVSPKVRYNQDHRTPPDQDHHAPPARISVPGISAPDHEAPFVKAELQGGKKDKPSTAPAEKLPRRAEPASSARLEKVAASPKQRSSDEPKTQRERIASSNRHNDAQRQWMEEAAKTTRSGATRRRSEAEPQSSGGVVRLMYRLYARLVQWWVDVK